ncbi:MAG: SWIM zinc finger family protein [Bacteroidetes bacterium]|nr:SWIM zinc finger family protein [Bacteroidota bacterium]
MMDDNWNFKPSKPREVVGGIKARSRRGTFGESWWARRWIEALERFDFRDRLARGRAYARSGQVLRIRIEPGIVTADVQGSRAEPYAVTIELPQFTTRQSNALIAVLARRTIFAARLLAGEMPEDIEDAVRDAGLSLFPGRAGDLHTTCNCPDWSNPCKHSAAVYYLLGEEFDRDPFLIFRLRGMEREQLAAKLAAGSEAASRPARGKKAVQSIPAQLPPPGKSSGKAHAARQRSAKAPQAVVQAGTTALRADVRAFWGAGIDIYQESVEFRIPSIPAALPRQLGAFPFWRASEPLADALAPYYDAASHHVLQSVLAGPDLHEADADSDR